MPGYVLLAVLAAAGGAALGLLLRRYVLVSAQVESDSMLPGLAPGQRLLARRGVGSVPARGDVVVVRSAELGRSVVKRVVGLPGERVEIGVRGEVVVDGRPLAEPYVARPGGPAGRFTVPRGHLLLLGDNRVASSDSRRWARPYVPITAVEGTVLRRAGRVREARAGRRRPGSGRPGLRPTGPAPHPAAPRTAC